MKPGLFISVFLFLSGISLLTCGQEITLPMLNEPLSDFSLADQNGQQVRLSDYQGKNVLLIFPRGMVKKDYWCQICHYQYAELAELEKKEQIRSKYRLEVLFVLPYQSDSIVNWVGMFPQQLEIIEGWKYPADTVNQTEKAKSWSIITRKLLPKTIRFEEDQIGTPFPVLADADRRVSAGFKLYKNEPDAPQNTPAIYLLDKNGILRFKYISQDTKDRPGYDYLFSFIEKMLN